MPPEQAAGRTARHRPGGRRLRPGGDPLRTADRPAAVPGGDGAGDAAAGARAGAGAPAAAQPGHSPRPGNDLPQVPGERTAAALRLGPRAGRGPAAVPQRRADPRPAAGTAGALLSLGPATPGTGHDLGGPVDLLRRAPGLPLLAPASRRRRLLSLVHHRPGARLGGRSGGFPGPAATHRPPPARDLQLGPDGCVLLHGLSVDGRRAAARCSRATCS